MPERPPPLLSGLTTLRVGGPARELVHATTTSTPRSSSGTTTGLVNLQPSSSTRPVPPAQVSRARAMSAWVYIPWAMTPGSPTDLATRSDQWIGLRSPLAPA